MPSRCSNSACPATKSSAEMKKAAGKRTACFMLPAKRSVSAHTSRPKKLTGPTSAVAVATNTATQVSIHKTWRR